MRHLAFLLCVSLLVGSAHAADDYFLATSFFRQGKFQKTLEAIDRLEKAEGATAISPSLLFTKAQCLASLERPRDAIEAIDDLLKRYPSSTYTANARTKLAQILEDQKSWKALIERLQQWIREDPSSTTWPRLLARAYVKDGQPQEAVKYLAGSPDPRNVETLFEVLNELGKLDDYLRDAEKTPDASFEGERRLGLLYGLRKDWAHARPHLEHARTLKVTDTDLLARMVGLAQDGRDLEHAIQYARELVAADPVTTAHVKKLGELQLAAGQRDAALGTWNQLRMKNQRDRAAHLLYANVLADHGLVDEAITGVEGARKVFDDPTLFAEDLGKLYERKGDVYGAAREYLQLVDAPGDKAPGLILAMVKRAAPRAPGGVGAPTPHPSPAASAAPSPATTSPAIAPVAAAPRWPALDDATRAVTEATRAHPASMELFYLLDDLYQLDPDPVKIRALCHELVAANTARTDAVIKAAHDFAAERRMLEARTTLSEVMPHLQPPDTWEISLELARFERQAGQLDDALAALNALAATPAPDSVITSARTLSAEILLEDRRDATAARKLLDELLAHYPESPTRPRWTFLVARCALAKLDVAEAAKLLSEVENVADNALLPQVVYREAQIDLMVDRLDDAKDKLQTLVVKYPASPLAENALRDLFFVSTRKAEVKEQEAAKAPTPPTTPPSTATTATASTAPPPPPTALPAKPSLIAEFFLQRHLIDAGLFADYEQRAAKLDPAKLPPGLKADFQMLAALVHRAKGQPQQAVEALEKLGKSLPEGPVLEDAILLRAEILEKDLGDRKQAEAVYDDYLMLYPNSVRAEEIRRKLEGQGAGSVSGQNAEPTAQ